MLTRTRRQNFRPFLTLLEDRRTPSHNDIFAVAADAGGGPRVQVFNEDGHKEDAARSGSFDDGFQGGIFVG